MSHDRARIGWICSYTPEEIIYAAGFHPVRLLPRENGSGFTDSLLPSNICPFTRQIAGNVEAGLYGKMDGIVVANSCNAMLHLYNVLSGTMPRKDNMFVYLLDLPRRKTPAAIEYFSRQLPGRRQGNHRCPAWKRRIRQDYEGNGSFKKKRCRFVTEPVLSKLKRYNIIFS